MAGFATGAIFLPEQHFLILHNLGLEYRQRIGTEQQAGRQAP
jgi:hypothetical protein